MNIRPKVRNAVLVSALAAVAATAWATNESLSTTAYVPDNAVTTQAPMNGALLPNEAAVPRSELAALPAEDSGVAQPGITVEERKLSNDERIQAQVIDKLANNARLSGKIGVESHEAVVTLTGYTLTAGQAYRAGREAGSVMGVKYVQNEIRPRIGGSV